MICYIEDDENIRQLVVYALNNSGLEAVGYPDGASFFNQTDNEDISIILLDIMLPEENGISILKKLKASSKYKEVPVIMLSAKGSEMDKVSALNFGADDYMVKPFGVMELIARIKAVLRRSSEPNTTFYTLDRLSIDRAKHQVVLDGQELNLTNKEFELLYLFMANPDQVFSREKLLKDVWGYEYTGDTRTVDAHIKMLRQKCGRFSQHIETVFGVGYKLRSENV